MDRLKIFEVTNPSNFVLFDHNPEQLKMTGRAAGGGRSQSKPAKAGVSGSGGGHHGTQGQGSDPTKVTISKARLTGPLTKTMCDTLLGWTAPRIDLLAMAASLIGINIGPRLPILLMQWGPPKVGFTFTATMTQVDITYVRVSDEGMPTHAMINLTLKEEPTVLSMTNPTSGGRPGRATHTVTTDETLMSVATKAFGHPGAWRAIADVNGIDDPTALRPGQVLYLPARDELAKLSEGSR